MSSPLHAAILKFGVKCTKRQLLHFVARCNPKFGDEKLAKLVGYNLAHLRTKDIQKELNTIREFEPDQPNGHYNADGSVESVTDEPTDLDGNFLSPEDFPTSP